MNKMIGSCGLLLLWTAVAGSQTPQPRFERSLIPGGPGANRISPDVALLSGVANSGLRDLRFSDAAGKEVPYLLIPPETPEPRWIIAGTKCRMTLATPLMLTAIT